MLLYTFSEGSGAVVHDTGGQTPPLDLDISDESGGIWLDGGYEVQQSMNISSPLAATRVNDALIASGALTLEAVRRQDLYVVLAGLVMSSAMLVLGNLVADILLKINDPRISYER